MPRPKTIREPTVTYNLLIARRVYDALVMEASKSGRPAAELIREAIDDWLERDHVTWSF